MLGVVCSACVASSCGARSGVGAGLDHTAVDAGTGDGELLDAGRYDAGPACEPSPERCGGGDDDCDGRVDEGLAFGPLAEPTVVFTPEADRRPVNEALVSTSEGLLAVWRWSYDRSAPEPNVLVRRLDDAGEPVEEARLLLERPVSDGLRFAPSVGRTHAFIYCGRFASDELVAAWRIDARGRTVGAEWRPRATDDRCGSGEPSILWTGERHFFAWTDNSPDGRGLFDTQLHLADSELRPLEGRTLGTDWASMPRMARSGGSVLLAWKAATLRLLAHDLDGSPHGDIVNVGLPPPAPGETEGVWGEEHPVLPRADGGFLVLSETFTTLIRVVVGPDGRVMDGPSVMSLEGEAEMAVGSLRAVPRPGGGAYAAVVRNDGRVHVIRLDDDGRLVDTTAVTEAPVRWPGTPALTTHEGRLFVSWPEMLDRDRGRLRIRVFGCTP